jgi:hypothetical protein
MSADTIEPCASCRPLVEHLVRQRDDARRTNGLAPELIAVAKAARELKDRRREPCVVDPPCGDCVVCRFDAALLALAEKEKAP